MCFRWKVVCVCAGKLCVSVGILLKDFVLNLIVNLCALLEIGDRLL